MSKLQARASRRRRARANRSTNARARRPCHYRLSLILRITLPAGKQTDGSSDCARKKKEWIQDQHDQGFGRLDSPGFQVCKIGQCEQREADCPWRKGQNNQKRVQIFGQVMGPISRIRRSAQIESPFAKKSAERFGQLKLFGEKFFPTGFL